MLTQAIINIALLTAFLGDPDNTNPGIYNIVYLFRFYDYFRPGLLIPGSVS